MEQQARVVYVVEHGCRVTGCLHHAEEKETAGVGQVFVMTFTKNNLRSGIFDNEHESMCLSKLEKKKLLSSLSWETRLQLHSCWACVHAACICPHADQ